MQTTMNKQGCVCNQLEESENDFVNPLLTQDSRQPQSKIIKNFSDISGKTIHTSETRRNFRNKADAHSMLVDKNDQIHYQYMDGISDNNPLIDSDSQQKESFEKHSRSSNKMVQSKSYNSLLRASNNFRQSGYGKGIAKDVTPERHFKNIKNCEATKMSSREYNSSIHQCKPTCAHRTSSNGVDRQLGKDFKKFEINTELDNCFTNGSETASSKFNEFNFHKPNEGATYSNISMAHNHNDEDMVYSSAEELAADMITKKRFEDRSHTQSHVFFPKRYNDSFGQNELKLDTSSNALLLKDI
jgi:hypothetical protein